MWCVVIDVNISSVVKFMAFLVACTLPSVSSSIYFYQPKEKESRIENVEEATKEGSKIAVKTSDKEDPRFSWSKAWRLLWLHFRSSCSNNTILFWSLWWILLEGGYGMLNMYNQPLWSFIEPDREVEYNGFAEMGLTLFGAIGAQLAGRISQECVERNAILLVVLSSVLCGAFSIIAAITKTVFVSYGMYVLTGAIYNFTVTLTR